jgi:hypothetical protein
MKKSRGSEKEAGEIGGEREVKITGVRKKGK